VQAELIRVNYTHKLLHFLLFSLQFMFRGLDPALLTLPVRIVDGALALALALAATTLIFILPLRSRRMVLATMFAAFDRPEDRPHTLRWISIQLVLTYTVAFPLHLHFQTLGLPQMLTILILINAIGDGLAEPVGVRFGRHRYQVRGFFDQRTYQRSLEGSACVLLSAVAALLLFHNSFTMMQWCAALLLPIAVTLAEAWAPHTVDSPLIFLTGGGVLSGVLLLP